METHWGDGKDTTDTSRVWHDGDVVAGPDDEVFDEDSVDTVGDEEVEDTSETKEEADAEESVADPETPSSPSELSENTNVETDVEEK